MDNLLENNIKLIGLKMPYNDNFCSYFEKLPDTFTPCRDFMIFYKLQKGKKKIIKDNLELNVGLQYLVYSPTSEVFYYKIIQSYTDMNRVLKYFKDKNLYIFKDEMTPQGESSDNTLI